MSYTVTQHKRGIVVTGSIPIDDMDALATAWRRRHGYDTIAPGISAALNACAAICRREDVPEWEREIDEEAAKELNPVIAWLKSTDTGVSSRTIAAVLMDGTVERASFDNIGSPPLDDADFGRCQRLLERIPYDRWILGVVADRYPAWRPLVDHWDELAALMPEPKKLTVRIRELSR